MCIYTYINVCVCASIYCYPHRSGSVIQLWISFHFFFFVCVPACWNGISLCYCCLPRHCWASCIENAVDVCKMGGGRNKNKVGSLKVWCLKTLVQEKKEIGGRPKKKKKRRKKKRVKREKKNNDPTDQKGYVRVYLSILIYGILNSLLFFASIFSPRRPLNFLFI